MTYPFIHIRLEPCRTGDLWQVEIFGSTIYSQIYFGLL